MNKHYASLNRATIIEPVIFFLGCYGVDFLKGDANKSCL